MINSILNFDKSWLHAWNNFANSTSFWQTTIKFIAECLIYLVPIILIIYWFIKKSAQKVALRATFAGLLSWLFFANVIGNIIDRPRPFAVNGVKELFFHRPTYSFPSDHTAFLVAIAFSLILSGEKKMALLFLILTVAIGLSRIAAAIHYPTDIIGGALLGVIVAYLIHLLDRYLDGIYEFIINLAKKVRLA